MPRLPFLYSKLIWFFNAWWITPPSSTHYHYFIYFYMLHSYTQWMLCHHLQQKQRLSHFSSKILLCVGVKYNKSFEENLIIKCLMMLLRKINNDFNQHFLFVIFIVNFSVVIGFTVMCFALCFFVGNIIFWWVRSLN